jgi:hypothetical protein
VSQRTISAPKLVFAANYPLRGTAVPIYTPGWVKNMIRRSFRELVDPAPKRKQLDPLWSFFKSRCAYCGRKLDRAKKEGHIDHLIPASQGGSNHASNRVLSCATCNEKEKLDVPWKQFLKCKIANDRIRASRQRRIEEWRKRQGADAATLSPERRELVDKASEKAILAYDREVRRVRKAR